MATAKRKSKKSAKKSGKKSAKRPAKKAAKKAAPKKAKKAASKRKPNAAFMKAMTPSAVLAAVVGSMPLPRTEVTKKIWDSIKKRLINADEKLRQVFGGKRQVSMFEMTKLVSNHLK